jgi:hypothetical protein
MFAPSDSCSLEGGVPRPPCEELSRATLQQRLCDWNGLMPSSPVGEVTFVHLNPSPGAGQMATALLACLRQRPPHLPLSSDLSLGCPLALQLL